MLGQQKNIQPQVVVGKKDKTMKEARGTCWVGYQTKHYDICRSAVILYNKLKEKSNDESKELIVSSAKQLDHLFEMEKQVVNGEKVDHDPVEHAIELTNIISFQLGRVAEMINDDFERDTNFIKLHVMEIVKRS